MAGASKSHCSLQSLTALCFGVISCSGTPNYRHVLHGRIKKLKDVGNRIEKLKGKPDPKTAEQLTKLRLEAIRALSEALKSESKARHEKSHLLESYGALILALEEEFQKLCS